MRTPPGGTHDVWIDRFRGKPRLVHVPCNKILPLMPDWTPVEGYRENGSLRWVLKVSFYCRTCRVYISIDAPLLVSKWRADFEQEDMN